jgi:hypothetical protein
MESVVTLQELAKREAAKTKAEREARVKALTTEGLRMKQQPVKKARGGSVRKSYFSTY